MNKTDTLLIVANSARMLTELAKKTGYNPLVIDCFCDSDTSSFALDIIKVVSLEIEQIKTACSTLKRKHTITYLIYGSGFEMYKDSLEYLYQNFNVLGNTFAVFTAIQNKRYFFSTLTQLQISYPEVTFKTPETESSWLVKPLQSEGGIGIRDYKKQLFSNHACYWQKTVAGVAMSAIFAANGECVIVYGFHKQQTTAIGNQKYIFSGIISQPDLADKIVKTVTSWIEQLVLVYALKGINTLDFILKDEQCYVLEINPRLSASMQLYQANLLQQHVNCFLAEIIQPLQLSNVCYGYKIIYAISDCIINKDFQWPNWVKDRPKFGSLINTGMPICSIIADGKNEQYVEKSLSFRQQIILHAVYR